MAPNHPSAHLSLSWALVPKLQPYPAVGSCTTAWVPYQASGRVSLSSWLTLTRSEGQISCVMTLRSLWISFALFFYSPDFELDASLYVLTVL